MASLARLARRTRAGRLTQFNTRAMSAAPQGSVDPVAHMAAANPAVDRTLMADVHGTKHGKRSWRNKPLFKTGDKLFRSGDEASAMLIEDCAKRDPSQLEFHQSMKNTVTQLSPVFDRFPKYAWVMKQLLEPERVIQFRVPWLDDLGTSRVTRGFRVQYSSALGPYAGPLRFRNDVGIGLVKFLAFEQVLKNSLCGAGGAAGGSDFSPKGKSEAEVMRFCQSFMTELANYIGRDTDNLTTDVGVRQREMEYLFGQYKRMKIEYHSLWGGYPEISGYSVVYFAETMLNAKGQSLAGKRCLITGSGTVALHVADKLIQLGAIPITLSDSTGHVYEEAGFTPNKLRTVVKMKSVRDEKIGAYIMSSTTAQYCEPESVWNVPCDFAFPCATHNEVDAAAGNALSEGGCKGIFEGSTMSCTQDAITTLKRRGILYAPSQATHAGGVSVNMHRQPEFYRGSKHVDYLVEAASKDIHDELARTAAEYNVRGDMGAGASIAGFLKVAEAMVNQGAV
jgi:glutamate dehydrogenase (NADP+)